MELIWHILMEVPVSPTVPRAHMETLIMVLGQMFVWDARGDVRLVLVVPLLACPAKLDGFYTT